MMGHDQINENSMQNLTLDDNNQAQIPPINGANFPEIPATIIDDENFPPLPSKTPNSSLSSFVDPPSYADAMFRSFDGGERIAGDSPEDAEWVSITVSDPEKVAESTNSLVPGSGWYYSYLITTRTNSPEFGSPEFTVRRRFREVVGLADRLAESYRGFIIPLRPDKSVVESQMMQRSEFVEQRRVGIEKYLRRLAAHPGVRRGEELRGFLTGEGPEFGPRGIGEGNGGEVVVRREEGVQPGKGGRDLMRLFKELRQAVSNDWGGVRPPVVEEDKEFLEKKGRLADLEVQLSNVSQQAETLVKAQQDIGETMGELGLAFVKLTKFEFEEAVYECQRTRAADMKNMATAAVKASRLYRELNAQTVKHLDKLHDYLGMMLAVDNAFTDRSNALLTVQTLVSEISSLQSRIEKLEIAASKIFGGDRSRMQKIEELKETMKVTEDAKCCAVKEYEKIKENNRSELARLDKERRTDFLSMLKGFVVNQAGYAEKMADVWEKVAEETKGYANVS